jgi:hypothetical protein
MKIIFVILAIAILLGLQGCATVTKGTTDTVQVQVSNCSEPMSCTATNKKGSWTFTAPGPVKFKKSDQNLTIACNDGGAVLTGVLKPTRGGMIWGNVLVGGIIGGGLDALTDAHWNMTDTLVLYRNNCGQNNLSNSSQNVQYLNPRAQPPAQNAQPASQNMQSSSRSVQPSAQNVQPPTQKAQPPVQYVQPSSPNVQPPSQRMQPPAQYVTPSGQNVQSPSQNLQGSQSAGQPTYIVAPRPSRLQEVDARDRDDCDLITTITRNAGGNGDSSKFVKSAKNSALTEAVDKAADSYFIVNTESTLYGASVTLEALSCR